MREKAVGAGVAFSFGKHAEAERIFQYLRVPPAGHNDCRHVAVQRAVKMLNKRITEVQNDETDQQRNQRRARRSAASDTVAGRHGARP